MASYYAIQSFDQSLSRISDGYRIKSNPNTYSCGSHHANEDSIKEALETISIFFCFDQRLFESSFDKIA